MKRQLYNLLILGLLFSSCKKKDYPESVVENDPLFYFIGTINNRVVDFKAGIAEYQMFSSVTTNTDNVTDFTGSLRLAGCNQPCANSIEFRVSGYGGGPATLPIDKALSTGLHPLLVPAQKVQFKSAYNKTAKSYHWDFGDGTISITADPDHIYMKPGIYKACLTITDQNSCVSTICNEVKIGYSDKTCRTNIVITAVSDTVVSFSQVTAGGTGPYRYFWTFGDGTSSTLSNGDHVYKYPGSYPVQLKVIDAKNDTATASYNAVTKTDGSSCAANFQVITIANDPSFIFDVSKATVTWVDESGVVYTSKSDQQSTSSFFQIVSVTPYDNNENNEPTKKLLVRFKCDVFNGTNKITIDNAEAVITVAYK